MTIHQLVGYDPESERVAFSLPVTDKALLFISFQFDSDDPEGVFTYELDYSKATDLAGILHESKPPGNLVYFIEPYP